MRIAAVKLPSRTANQTLAGYLRMHLQLLQRYADAGIPQVEIRARIERLGFPPISKQTYWKQLWRARRWATSKAAAAASDTAAAASEAIAPARAGSAEPIAREGRPAARRQHEAEGGLQEKRPLDADAVALIGDRHDDSDSDASSEGLFTPKARARRRAEVDQFFAEPDSLLNTITRSKR